MRILHLYRPRMPSVRAQSIQVFHTCAALAKLGHEVTILADRESDFISLQQGLTKLGLQEHPLLQVQTNPFHYPPAAGLWFRKALIGWWLGTPGVVLARDKKRLLQALTWLPNKHRIFLESHEVDSLIAVEHGKDGTAWHAIEAKLLTRIDGLITNCGGTLKSWQENHKVELPSLISHNATVATENLPYTPQNVLRCLGSMGDWKAPDVYVKLADSSPLPIELIGPASSFQPPKHPNLSILPPVPYPAISGLLASSRVLLLSLKNNLFGRHLTSPLKLWDYLASTAPIVAPDVPSIQEIQQLSQQPFHWYQAEDHNSLLQAVNAALIAPPRSKGYLRTWLHRAQELETFISTTPRRNQAS